MTKITHYDLKISNRLLSFISLFSPTHYRLVQNLYRRPDCNVIFNDKQAKPRAQTIVYHFVP